MTQKIQTFFKLSTCAVMAAAPTWALAHTGHDHTTLAGLAEGFWHPLTGLDHLAAMLAIGVWSAMAVRPVWLAPLAFVLMLALGALLGFAGVHVPAIEPMIAASLLVIGLLMVWRRGMPWAAAAAVASVFAVFHGAAHGSEMAGSPTWSALTGMVMGSALLHGAGVLVGQRMAGRVWLQRSTGGALALMGSSLLVGLV
jgi:urease accessory protein